MHVFTIVPCFLITSYKQQHLSLFKMMVYSTRYQGKDNFTQKKHLSLKLKMRKNVGSLNIFCITRFSSHHIVDKTWKMILLIKFILYSLYQCILVCNIHCACYRKSVIEGRRNCLHLRVLQRLELHRYQKLRDKFLKKGDPHYDQGRAILLQLYEERKNTYYKGKESQKDFQVFKVNYPI